jgi:hypothetical protein
MSDLPLQPLPEAQISTYGMLPLKANTEMQSTGHGMPLRNTFETKRLRIGYF